MKNSSLHPHFAQRTLFDLPNGPSALTQFPELEVLDGTLDRIRRQYH